MRILHVSESLDPAHGGTPEVPKCLAAAQAALGHEVTILTRDEPERADAIRGSMAGIPGSDAVTIAAVPSERGLGGVVNRGARDWALARASRFDAAHLHSMWSPIPHGAARGLARAGVPYTLCPHGMLDAWSMRQSTPKKRLHLALVSRRTMARAAFLHALNAHEAETVRAFRFGPPVEVLGNGVWPGLIDTLPERGAFRAAHPRVGDDPCVLFLARLHHKKGLDLLAEAFASLVRAVPEARLVVVGPDGGAREPFERAVAGAGLADRVLLTGPLYGPEKHAALVDADAFCLPSRQEGFSVAILEAMAAGLPVVASEACHFPELAEMRPASGGASGGGGVAPGEVVPLEPARIADALARLLADRAEARRRGLAGRGLVLDRFTWPTIAARAVSLYERHSG